MTTPFARNRDLLTSHEAGQIITANGNRRTYIDVLLAIIQKEPGLTGGELGERVSFDGAWKRLSDLEREGLVFQGPPETYPGTGRKQATWFPRERQGVLL